MSESFRKLIGRRVREVWVRWAERQPNPKPSWLLGYDEITTAEQDADDCIGMAIWAECFDKFQSEIAESVMLKQQLKDMEARVKITEQQLTVICDGVNRRCGVDNNQLPLVSLDRMIGRHARDRVNLVAWVLRNMDEFGCFTGDCPHDLNSECIESIVQQYEEDEAAKGGWDE